MKIDFSSCKVDKYKSYGGANGGKLSVIFGNDRYMLKFPPIATKNTEMSYTNSCISEYIACNIIKILGFKVQDSILGNYKNKLVVACKDFENNDERLFEFAKIKNMTIETPGYNTEIEEILETIQWQELIEPSKVENFFWDMFILDAYLGNFDRHNGNWGFLINSKTKTADIAPIYDCGSCLFPQNTENDMYNILKNQKELDYRSYSQPMSALKYKGSRINYYEFLKDSKSNSKIMNSLRKIVELIENKEDEINKFVENTEYVSEIHKEFIKAVLKNRYEKILVKNNIKSYFSWR